MKCRHCQTELKLNFIDLGTAPPSNTYLNEGDLRQPEKYFPLRVMVCTECWLVQTEDFADAAELFSHDYAYFSSFSTTWLRHAEDYVAAMISRFNLGPGSLVAEIAANDGYLLHYVRGNGIPCFGVEPTHSTAVAARAKGIEIVEEFFGTQLAGILAGQGKQADLIVANNVLAHVPDINDFVSGFATLLKPGGVATFEFPHLLRLVDENQFDTIYHEHLFYFSLTALTRLFARHGLAIVDVERIPIHGGSLRLFIAPEAGAQPTVRVGALLAEEAAWGVDDFGVYAGFAERVAELRDDLRALLRELKSGGARIAAYGASAKGSTLLNYCDLGQEYLDFVVDRSTVKQGYHTPGTHLRILPPEHLLEVMPDYVLLLTWNFAEEILAQQAEYRKRGGRFIVPVPSPHVVDAED